MGKHFQHLLKIASFQKCISSLTEEDDLNDRDGESESRNIEQKITQFTDLARFQWILLPLLL